MYRFNLQNSRIAAYFLNILEIHLTLIQLNQQFTFKELQYILQICFEIKESKKNFNINT